MNGGAYTFFKLEWDSDFFKVPCARAILEKPLQQHEYEELISAFADYTFVTITNKNCDPVNSQWIGKHTKAFLADVNIWMDKELTQKTPLPENTIIVAGPDVEKTETLLSVSAFTVSKFLDDPELLKRGGNQVYNQKLLSAFQDPGKRFILTLDDDGECSGYFLFSHQEGYVQLEQASSIKQHKGIGTKLFLGVEYAAWEHGCKRIRTGLNLYNKPSMNIHMKLGYKFTECHHTYHLWNL